MEENLDNSIQREAQQSEQDMKYTPVIRGWLDDYKSTQNAINGGDRNFKPLVQFDPLDVDFSAPRHEDLDEFNNGTYTIRDVKTAPKTDNDGKITGVSYHFYLGRPNGKSETEVHIAGKAADEVTARLEAEKAQNVNSDSSETP